MKVNFSLYVELEYIEFTLNTKDLARNYDDENYAYWIVEDKFGYVHEINIDKSENGEFLLTGCDYVWFDKGDFEAGRDADASEPIVFTL